MKSFDTIFKAYDVRGIYPSQLNEKMAYRIGEAYAATRKPKQIAVGRDVRSSGDGLKKELISALVNNGIDVVDIGVITTDQLYFAVGHYGLDGGISVTASHNPGEYNGFKFSDAAGAPIGSESLEAMRDWAASDNKSLGNSLGKISTKDILDDYLNHVLSYVDPSKIKPLRIVVNANFGAVGRVVEEIAERLNLKLDKLNWEEDGSFPKGPPNPLLPENRDETTANIRATRPDFGVAWDADADRVFFFAGDGTFIPSCYIIALLASEFLKKYPGAKIVHDITLRWVVDDAISAAGGQPILNRVGHTFIKTRMRKEKAPFAAESSGHYYFQKSFYADNGVAPLMMVLEIVSRTGQSLSQLIAPLKKRYYMIDETNFRVADPETCISRIERALGDQGVVDKTDGVTIESQIWRINLRPSNTEPLIRLNAEAHDQKTLDNIVDRVLGLINT